MATIEEHLANSFVADDMPEWLAVYKPDQGTGRSRRTLVQEFLQSRLIYYPGSGQDGGAVKLFNIAKVASCFVYVDYMLTRQNLASEIKTAGFNGYDVLDTIDLKPEDLISSPFVPHLGPEETHGSRRFVDPSEPYATLTIFEKSDPAVPGYPRFAVLFLFADGHAAYDALFCQRDSGPPPFGVVLQDHGFGGNWSPFGEGGALHTIAHRADKFPELLLVGDNTTSWPGYQKVPDVSGQYCGGSRWRFLHERHQPA
jgi:hypothetical protein